MGDERRRRSDSRSPQRPRSGRSGRDGDREDGGRYERGAEQERERELERGRERRSERDDRGRRGYDEDGGRGGRAAPVRIKEEPQEREAAGPRGEERQRERDHDRERRPERDDWDGRGAGGGHSGRRGGDEERPHRAGDGRGGGSGVKRERERGGEHDAEPKRERGRDDWGAPPGGGRGGGGGDRGGGRGGGRGGRESDPRYMSREEREDKEREAEEAAKPKAPKEQPNMGLSGKLAEATNKVGGTVLKHVPPQDAKLPDKRWRLYCFKNDQLQDEPYRLHKQDHFLFGRDVGVADIITAHVSCSKQHAVLQYRLTTKQDEFGLDAAAVRPYLLDLGSVNGTFLNGERIEALRYTELLEKDVIRFGQSSREYVLLHDKSGDA